MAPYPPLVRSSAASLAEDKERDQLFAQEIVLPTTKTTHCSLRLPLAFFDAIAVDKFRGKFTSSSVTHSHLPGERIFPRSLTRSDHRNLMQLLAVVVLVVDESLGVFSRLSGLG